MTDSTSSTTTTYTSTNNNHDEPMVVTKARTAYLYYQTEHLSRVRAELGNASMGEAMTELSRQYHLMQDRSKYEQLEAADRLRFEQESAQADEAARIRLEERRAADMDVTSGRSARQRIEQDRLAKEHKRAQRRKMAAENMTEEEREERQRVADEKKRETEERRQKKQVEVDALNKVHKKLDKEEAKKASQRLEYLVKQSSIFAKLSGGKTGTSLHEATSPSRASAAAAEADKNINVHHVHSKDSNASEDEELLEGEEEASEQRVVFLSQQPSVIKHGQMKGYQIEALNWMIHLADKGLNGILADEMGLGKTLQSISILGYFYEFRRTQGPHLITVPKSTLSNWMNELKRWCPVLRVVKFHGSREEREYMIDNYFTDQAASHDGFRPDKQIMNEHGELVDDNTNNPRPWDVCVTTYEIANQERKTLQKFAWKYLVIDEAHRLKNDASMFSKTVRSFRASNRLLLTGTPLQNNLHELWALLNFLLPDIFSSSEQFDEWFDLEIDDEEAKKNIISQLHKILRPFMLRRLKVDVAKGLPPKTETILMVGLSKMQKQLYKKLLLRDLDSLTSKTTNKQRTAVLNIVMQLRKCCGHPYLFEGMEDRSLDPLGEHLVDNCGKLSMVDKLLKRLFERGHRVLIFTQMTRILDILEDLMVMRGFKYCRIDGNTNYDDRESAIDNFNAPNSEKFVFILSTRAGGLGINLQTADVCILYDSDWNPQQDLQAQDRCHRLGQKRPVQIFRLVCEHTVEQKIVERAQQKLKLDAMVVQQGRLKDKDKVTKEEIMAAVRFGADDIFRSEESTITDEDIDIILERGAAKTKELHEKIQKADKGDLLDFRLDGGISAQTFEGVDYSDKDLRDHLRMLAADSMGKRERRPPPKEYQPIIESKKSMLVNNQKIKLPKALRIPQMEDHHFYNRERLLELGNLEFETYAALREAGQVPPKDVLQREGSLLPFELAQEKRELLAEGFGDWSRSQYFNFVKACAKFGRDDVPGIAAELDMPEGIVSAYSDAFWRYGETELKSDWEKVITQIERGEKKIAKQKKLSALLGNFIATFDDPRNEIVFANKGTTFFALEQDRALLTAVNKHGYGNWDSVREEIRTDTRLKFQHAVQGMSVQAIAKRCDYRMRQMEKELDAREKALKSKKPAAIVSAQRAIEGIKEMDLWEMQYRDSLLEGERPPDFHTLSHDSQMILRERFKEQAGAIDRLREIEVQVQRCENLAEATRQSIQEGAQYVNYSNITLKSGGPAMAMDGKDETTGLTVEEGIDLEATINREVLKVKPCGHCENCTLYSNRLCTARLNIRNQVIASEIKRLTSKDALKKKSSKKRKVMAPTSPQSESMPPPPPAWSRSSSISSLAAPSASKAQPLGRHVDGQTKPRVTSLGNRRMNIPDELLPEFCHRISPQGTSDRNKLINDFAADFPQVSVRQVTMKFNEVVLRERPACVSDEPIHKVKGKKGRVFVFYLRPRCYKYLPEDERPVDWEKYAELDEIAYQNELAYEAEAKQIKKEANKRDKRLSTETDTSMGRMSLNGFEEDGESGYEHEVSEGEPSAKKARLEDDY
ncbi:hypothetical protein MPSEU_000221000 [Mayamaea pseudoterrestris]|nr:hypothetical protein MPSEU_000221000 [Mayamaea pseudoterrestris]